MYIISKNITHHSITKAYRLATSQSLSAPASLSLSLVVRLCEIYEAITATKNI